VAVRDRSCLNGRRFASIVTMCLTILTGCDRTTSPSPGMAAMETAFWASVPMSQPDGTLSLAIANEASVLDPEAPINFILENASQSEVRFQPGYGARMFAYVSDEQRWVEVENRADYIGREDTLAPSSDPSGNWMALVTVAPDIAGIELPVTLRVVVEGDVLSGGTATGERASAYADIMLER